jgi:hypothetical protein
MNLFSYKTTTMLARPNISFCSVNNTLLIRVLQLYETRKHFLLGQNAEFLLEHVICILTTRD